MSCIYMSLKVFFLKRMDGYALGEMNMAGGEYASWVGRSCRLDVSTTGTRRRRLHPRLHAIR